MRARRILFPQHLLIFVMWGLFMHHLVTFYCLSSPRNKILTIVWLHLIRGFATEMNMCIFFWNNEGILSLMLLCKPLCHELVCITVKWTWYNGRDIFFHITSGRINTWKGVTQLKEPFFLHLNYLHLSYRFLNIHLKLTNHMYLMIKNPSLFKIHNKNGVLL